MDRGWRLLQNIERLRASLHKLDEAEKAPNKHIVFVDSKKEGQHFNPRLRLVTFQPHYDPDSLPLILTMALTCYASLMLTNRS